MKCLTICNTWDTIASLLFRDVARLRELQGFNKRRSFKEKMHAALDVSERDIYRFKKEDGGNASLIK